MQFKTALQVSAHQRPFVLIVEPWADEFLIFGSEECKVIASHPTSPPTFGAAICGDGDLMIWIDEGGATYEFWRGCVQEFHASVPIPTLHSSDGIDG